MEAKLNVALIGCGYWGKNYLRLLNDLEDSNVVMVCDQNPAVKDTYLAKYPEIEFTTNHQDVVNRDDIDAVVIATITTEHYNIAADCIRAGKHALIEKPLTSTAAQGEELVTLAEEHGVKLMVGHIYLYNSAIQRAKEIMHDERLGQLHYLYTQRTNLGPIRHDVNVAWDLAPHDISILNYFMDAEPEWVSAVGHNLSTSEHADVAFITMGYPGNVVGHIHVSWADPSKVRDVVIVGSQRRIYLNDMDPQEPIRIFERGLEPSAHDTTIENRFTIRDGDIISPRLKMSEPLRAECQHFIDCVVNDETPLSHGESGASVVRVLEAIDKSIERNGARVMVGASEEELQGALN